MGAPPTAKLSRHPEAAASGERDKNSRAPPPAPTAEQGDPGSLTAYADFTCPKCGEHTRFLPSDQDEDGGFTCPHCRLIVEIHGTRLSDYQSQRDIINADVRRFAVEARWE